MQKRIHHTIPPEGRVIKEPSPYTRLWVALGLIVLLMSIGTLGYMTVEHWNLLDALFMTVITFSTVGYGEVHKLDPQGKILTILLILFGGGIATWALLSLGETLVSDQSRRFLQTRRIMRRVKMMKDHYIVVGYGRIGQSICRGYIRNQVPFVVLDLPGPRIEQMRLDGIPHIEGDASNDEVLRSAGIMEARALLAVTPVDAVNTFVTLSARELRKDLMIVARCDDMTNAAKLRRAGANKVVSPHMLGGWWMATTAINPAATDFIEGISLADHTKVIIYEVTVGPELDGQSLFSQQFRKHTGALVLATRREGVFHANPGDEMVLKSGDAVIAIGSPVQLKKLAKLCNPHNPSVIDVPFGAGA